MKKMSSIFVSLLLILCISFSSCSTLAKTAEIIDNVTTTSSQTENIQNTETENGTELTQANEYTIKDDFYNYVNADWISNQTLSESQSSTSNFADVSNESFSLLYYVLSQAVSMELDQGDDDLAKLTKFYKTSLNYDARNTDKTNPITKYADKIKAISSIEELQQVATELDKDMIGSFMMFNIRPDLGDSTTNRLYISGPSLSFGEKSYYSDSSERGLKLIEAYKDMLKKLFVLSGETEQDAVKMTEAAYRIEKELADSTFSIYEAMDESLTYNKFDLDELSSKYKNFNIKDFLSGVGLENPEFVIVTEPNYYDKLDEIMVSENLEDIKCFMYAQMLSQTADYLTSEHLMLTGDFRNILSGTTGYRNETDQALSITQENLGEIMGRVYVENFFSHEAKDEVLNMTYNIIDTYKKRIENLEWMSDETKAEAIKKLDNMSVKVGYPDEWTDFSTLEVQSYDEGGSLFQNVVNHYHFTYKDFLATLDQPVDRTEWHMDAHEANAYYSPSLNEIVFPAGILNKPFFDIEASESQNYGAIGSIIAHEVSHAFDESGSRYDEFGNLSNWWTESDRKNYEELTEKLVDLFDGYEIVPGYAVDGRSTLDENISDLSGMHCVVDVVKALPDGNLDETFTSFARIWASKSTDEYKINMIMQDTHSPDMLRVNLLLPNVNEFYEVYDIHEGDGMYVAESDRIRIW